MGKRRLQDGRRPDWTAVGGADSDSVANTGFAPEVVVVVVVGNGNCDDSWAGD